MDLHFQNRVAFITGGASGIGRQTAIAFAKEGARVALADVQDVGAKVADEIRNGGAEAIFFHCDTSNEVEIGETISKILSHFGRLDYAFNNAGIEGIPAAAADCTTENWDHILNVNLKGVWLCMKHEIPRMLQQGGGSIVNCSSIAGLVGFPGIPAYVASKHGVVGLTRNAALDYATSNIRVNAVCPGVIQTPMIDRFTKNNPEAHRQLISQEPVGRIGLPQEVADAVLWLCSDRASFITGEALAVDGGWVAH